MAFVLCYLVRDLQWVTGGKGGSRTDWCALQVVGERAVGSGREGAEHHAVHIDLEVVGLTGRNMQGGAGRQGNQLALDGGRHGTAHDVEGLVVGVDDACRLEVLLGTEDGDLDPAVVLAGKDDAVGLGTTPELLREVDLAGVTDENHGSSLLGAADLR